MNQQAETRQAAIEQTIACIASRFSTPVPRPAWGLILGSGLGGVADQIETQASIAYADLPGFAVPRAAGHAGRLILGRWQGVDVVAMAGRFHLYEGWSFDQITFPVAVMAALGATNLIVSNAAGGVRPGLRVGDLILIADSIDWMRGLGAGGVGLGAGGMGLGAGGANPAHAGLGGARSPNPSGRRCDASMYDSQWRQWALRWARKLDVRLSEGTYLAMSGPTYETRAEYRMMRRMGVDVVGMSTVPEALHGYRLGMRVLGFSMVSNVANPDRPSETHHDEVIEAGKRGAQDLQRILGFLGKV
ncbi:MAG: purine-nucleoside phosphorylase [Planctomycetota bacterium]